MQALSHRVTGWPCLLPPFPYPLDPPLSPPSAPFPPAPLTQLSDLTSLYKARLTPDTSKAFVALVKQVARIEPGSKYLVLKE